MAVAKKTAVKPASAKKTAPAAKKTVASKVQTKAAPARASKRTVVVEDDEPDLLAGMEENDTVLDEDDEAYDLLSDLSEDDGEPWYPWDEDGEDQPHGIQGTVTLIGEVEREQRFGGGSAPLIQLDDGENGVVWSVRGYSMVLANQINRELERGLAVGDRMAIKYFGEKENRRGDNSYRNFAVASKKKKR